MQVILNCKRESHQNGVPNLIYQAIVETDYIIYRDNKIELLVGDNYFRTCDRISLEDYRELFSKILKEGFRIDLTKICPELLFGMNIA